MNKIIGYLPEYTSCMKQHMWTPLPWMERGQGVEVLPVVAVEAAAREQVAGEEQELARKLGTL